jgi:hypothetical protein
MGPGGLGSTEIPDASPLGGLAVSPTVRSVMNFVLFYSGWFGCAYGLALGWWWLGPIAALIVVGTHLLFSLERRRAVEALAVVTLLGPLIDTALLSLDAVRVTEPRLLGIYAPPTLIALWAIFGTTFHSSLGWLCTRPVLSVPFSAIGAPLTYIAAERLGALEIVGGWSVGLIYIVVSWVLGLPALLWVSSRIYCRSAAAS